VAWLFFTLGITLHLMLSPEALIALGFPYTATEGPPYAKFHPGTYCLMLAWFMAATSHGNPVGVLAGQLARHTLLTSYFACMVLLFFWSSYRHGMSGTAFIIETLWTPAIAAFVLYLLNLRRHRQIVQIVVALLVCNAVVAIGESLTGKLLLPRTFAEEYFRASAFLGHPLSGAGIVVVLLPAITLMPWPWLVRLTSGILLALSLFAFGGRASLLIGFVYYGAYALYRLFISVVRGRFSYLQLTGGSLALILCLTLVAGVVAITGIGERFFQTLRWDDSAAVRGRVWEIFAFLSPTDLWTGIAPAEIDHISLRIGLDPRFEAIENFWLYLLMQFGILGYIPFILGLAFLVALLWRAATPLMRIAVFVFFMVASTSNSLSTKTMSLMLLTVVVLACPAFRSPLLATCASRGGYRLRGSD
jgi:hypothetical protein